MKRPAVIATIVALGVAVLAGALLLRGSRGFGSLPGDRIAVPAPIDGLDVRVLESQPPRYFLHVLAGLPSGCAQPFRHDVERHGETIQVVVLNSFPKGNPVCTAIYGTYELNIDLGSDYRRGVTYTVHVNDRSTNFTAQ